MLLELEGGFEVALDSIHMRIVQERQEKKELSPKLIAAGRIVIEACEFNRRINNDAHALLEVIEACLDSADAIPTAQMLLACLREAHANYRLGFTEENRVLSALFAAQPVVVVNDLFAPEGRDERTGLRGFFDHDDLIGSPLDSIPERRCLRSATNIALCDIPELQTIGFRLARSPILISHSGNPPRRPC